MKQSCFTKIRQIAQDILGDNYVSIGFGGSCLRKENPGDYDMIIIIRRMSEDVREFVSTLSKERINASVCPITLGQTPKTIPSKAATMIHDGMKWLDDTKIDISNKLYRKILKRNKYMEIYAIDRKIIDGKLSWEKGYQLLRQTLLAI